MRIVKGPDVDVCTRAIAGVMFNIENGAKVVQDNGTSLNRLPTPVPGYVSIPVRASVQNAPPLDFWCYPRVGLVFYTTSISRHVADLVSRISKILSGLGHDHLVRTFNPVEAAPCGILYHGTDRMILPETKVVGPRRPFLRAGPGPTVPARMLLWSAASNETALPGPISYRAAFTWVFMNVTAVMDVVIRPVTFNALTASVLYDVDDFSRFKMGQIVFAFPFEDLTFEPLAPAVKNIATHIETTRRKHTLGFVLDPRARRIHVLYGGKYTIAPDSRSTLPLEPHVLETESRCFMCSAAVWGEYFTLGGLRWPSAHAVDGWLPWEIGHVGSPIAPTDADPYMVVCRFCFGAFPKCFAKHYPHATVHRHVAPRGQADALRAAKADPLATLVELVEDGVRPVAMTEGAFMIGKNGDVLLLNGNLYGMLAIVKNPSLVAFRKRPVIVEFQEVK